MSELAFNINGEAFEVPAHATGWRVRRMRSKGAPEVVYGRDGLPLVLPISAELEDLRSEVDVAGRYRLDLVDTSNKAIPSAPSGYVQVNHAPATPNSAVTSIVPSPPSDQITIELVRAQSTLAQLVVERFPHMMEAAATLLRAADGAGLPARPPMALVDGEAEDEEHDDETPEERTASIVDLLQPMVGPAVQYVVSGFMSGQLKLPGNLAEMFDWRKAAARGKQAAGEVSTAPVPSHVAEPAPESLVATEPPKPSLQDAAHFVAIQNALDPKEAAFARAAAGHFTREQLDAWLSKLGRLSVPEAVAEIRAEISKSTAAGAVS